MTATYSTALTADKDKVRFYTGDRDVSVAANAMFSDEEIAAILVPYPDTVDASCELLEAMCSEYSHKPSTSTLGLSLGAERYQQCKDRLASLRRMKAARRLSAGVEMTAGGRLISERDDLAADTDAIQPAFTTIQHDYPGTDPADVEESER